MDRLGFISDTHGRPERARRAVALLLERGATHIVHLGDVGSESVLDLLAGLPATVVFGNCDDERGLRRYAEFLGIEVAHPAAVLEVKPLGGARSARVGITHGHLEDAMAELFASNVDFLLHGHTHRVRDEQIGATRVLNPGALHRAERHTALLLDVARGTVEWLEVADV